MDKEDVMCVCIPMHICVCVYIYIYIYIYIHVHTHTHIGIYLFHYKKRNVDMCDNMDRHGGIMLTEISQTEKDKYCLLSHISGI